jgi:Helix-turn-helix domain
MSVRPEPVLPRTVALSFGARMRHERERRKVSIASIAETTKILGALLEGLEHDDVSRWPTGLYRRSFMRAYASAVGLDPETTVKEFLLAFPDPDAARALPAARRGAAEPWVSSASTVEAGVPTDLRMSLATIRVAAPRPGVWFTPGTLIQGFPARALAAAVDWFVLSVLGLAAYALVGSFWAPLCGAAALYYGGSILLLGNTPGVCLFADGRNTRPTRRTPSTRRRTLEQLLSTLRDRALPLRDRVFSVFSRAWTVFLSHPFPK